MTNSRSLSDSVTARATRVKAGMPRMPITRVRLSDRLAEIGGDGEREHQRREGQQHVDAAHDQRLEAAAEVARQHAERAADRDADHRRQQADGERDAARHRSGGRTRRGRAGRCPANARRSGSARLPSMSMSVGLGIGSRSAKIGGRARSARSRPPRPGTARPAPSPAHRRDGCGVDADVKRGHGGSWDRARRRACRR